MARSNTNHAAFTPLLNLSSFPLVDETFGRLAGLFDFSVPEGYQDETGFHFSPGRSPGSQSSPVEYPGLGEHI